MVRMKLLGGLVTHGLHLAVMCGYIFEVSITLMMFRALLVVKSFDSWQLERKKDNSKSW